MTIVSSAVIDDRAQIDGRRYITEAHTDHLGVVHSRLYLAPADYVPDLAATAALIEASLAAAELDANEGEVVDGDV